MQEKKKSISGDSALRALSPACVGSNVFSRGERVSDADVPVETQVPVDVQLPVGVQVPVLLLTGSSSSNWSKHRDNR